MFFCINPIAFSIGPIHVYWYGLMYVLSFLIAYILGTRKIIKTKNMPITIQEFENLIHYISIGVILGGRIGYIIIYDINNFLENPLCIFYIWQGGMSFHGGLLGVIITIFFYSKSINKDFFTISDFVAPLVPLGIAAGRFGNFINGELWGKITNLPIGFIFPLSGDFIPRHPSQIYEMITEGFLLFLILNLISKRQPKKGIISVTFIIAYGIIRFFMEFLRDSQIIIYTTYINLTMGQILSIIMIAIGMIIKSINKL